MAYARTQLGAQKRVVMKRRLRRSGISIPSTINTKLLRLLYRAKYGKTELRKVDKMKLKRYGRY